MVQQTGTAGALQLDCMLRSPNKLTPILLLFVLLLNCHKSREATMLKGRRSRPLGQHIAVICLNVAPGFYSSIMGIANCNEVQMWCEYSKQAMLKLKRHNSRTT